MKLTTLGRALFADRRDRRFVRAALAAIATGDYIVLRDLGGGRPRLRATTWLMCMESDPLAWQALADSWVPEMTALLSIGEISRLMDASLLQGSSDEFVDLCRREEASWSERDGDGTWLLDLALVVAVRRQDAGATSALIELARPCRPAQLIAAWTAIAEGDRAALESIVKSKSWRRLGGERPLWRHLCADMELLTIEDRKTRYASALAAVGAGRPVHALISYSEALAESSPAGATRLTLFRCSAASPDGSALPHGRRVTAFVVGAGEQAVRTEVQPLLEAYRPAGGVAEWPPYEIQVAAAGHDGALHASPGLLCLATSQTVERQQSDNRVTHALDFTHQPLLAALTQALGGNGPSLVARRLDALQLGRRSLIR